ncbi:uncharacterized protein [Prorops nasuta]|uniref:uncharacterized protein isoform X2 n=1 Tax=Prorops nasuta TaxID=863751 RepID=UPI0034CECD72
MCTRKYRLASILLIFFGILLSSGSCQNAAPRGVTGKYDQRHVQDTPERQFSWKESPGGDTTLHETERSFASRNVAGAEVEPEATGNKNGQVLEASGNSAMSYPRRGLNVTTDKSRKRYGSIDRGRKKRRRTKGSDSAGHLDDSVRENEIRDKSRRDERPAAGSQARRSRAERRRRRKERERSRRTGRKRNRTRQDGLESRGSKSKGRMSDYLLLKKLSSNSYAEDPEGASSSTTSAILQDRSTTDDNSGMSQRGTAKRLPYKEIVERQLSKQLEKEIGKSAAAGMPPDDITRIEDRILGSPIMSSHHGMKEYDFRKENEILDDRYRFGNSRYDAERMLGYSRTAPEDLPILDLENDVLLDRTLKDYSAYMTSSLTRATYFEDSRSTSETSNSEISTLRPLEDDPRGDLSCINGSFQPAPLSRHALIKYVKSSTPGHEYLEADYECAPGYYMLTSNKRLLCKNRQWIGQVPKCTVKQNLDGVCAESSCEHVCKEVDGTVQCSCYKGFRLDGYKCIDINECEVNNGGCEYKCVNTAGSFRCECPNGMRHGENRFTCMDINECLLNNGHGPCQDSCRNLFGSYECSCENLQGTVLAADNHTCRDAEPCSVNNAGCSHTCLSTMGRVFCLCPDGYVLEDDWKTCQDVDECAVPDLQTEVCRYGCINTPGSYRCAKPSELKDQSLLEFLPTPCVPGYEVGPEGSCIDINSVVCPPLSPAGRGYLMCAQSAAPAKPWRGRRKVTNRPGTKCFLKCPRGYQMHGEYELACQSDGIWDGPKQGECVRYSKPRLECPKDITAELPPGRDEAFVTFDQPATDLDWFRYVRSKPSWGTRLEANLKPGIHEVAFLARHPVSKKQTSCTLRITVKEGEAPKVKNCPDDIEVTGKNGTAIVWDEPIFTDNVKVTRISSNESPGRHFDVGGHRVEYEANDEAGWSSKCVFTVVLRQE